MRLIGPDLFPVYDFASHNFILVHEPTLRTVIVSDLEVEQAAGALGGHWTTAYYCVRLAQDKLHMDLDEQVSEKMRATALRLFADQQREELRAQRGVDLIKQFRVMKERQRSEGISFDIKTGEETKDEQRNEGTEGESSLGAD